LGTIGLTLGCCSAHRPISRSWSGSPAAGVRSDVYYLSRLPAKIDWLEVAAIAAFAVGMACVWALPPAWRASRLDPVEALRFE
jgi:lipoprotein-releasing system permease protein